MFKNRSTAGVKLAKKLTDQEVKVDKVVAVYPKGNPVGKRISDRFAAPHRNIIYREISPPDYPWLNIGAVTSGGTIWLDDFLVEDYEVDRNQISKLYYQQRKRAMQIFRHKKLKKPTEVRGKNIVLVEDGLDNGLGMMACVGHMMKLGARNITVAVPFAPEKVVNSLQKVADDVVTLEMPRYVGVIDDCYSSELTH